MSDWLIVIDVHLLLVRGTEVLLSKRRGAFADGVWHLPAGKLEPGESVLAAAAREAEEETGVLIGLDDLRLVHTTHVHVGGGGSRMGLFFEVREWGGEPVNREPDKCYALEWFDRDRLPTDLLPYSLTGIRGYLDGTPLTVLGWADPA
ncbi:NUDIX domain-containing protein [Umezawaea sp. Da 62-37]|uniref:NUDIX domain-containing protein n=1 Tax=Umezawaea sp. Da 62-37 TaxID=3075927 RepID=UPI0028F6DB54|nr:NUDIX domain-containing protein [Umezawaea sp. Da 62-37]WNV91605.1 NUDIX domain-containing protein [Umezawaea sp. Da 62-37]